MSKTKKIIFAVLFIFILLIISDEDKPKATPSENINYRSTNSNALPRSGRILAVDVTEPKSKNYNSAFNLAQNLGISQVGLYFNWNALETAPGQNDDTYLRIARDYYPAKGVKLDLTVTPINTNQLVVPTDLQKTSFDDPALINRYLKLADHVITLIGTKNISSFIVASEADVYFRSDGDWKKFQTFYTAVSRHFDQNYPSIPIAFESTYDGATGSNREKVASINKWSDVIGISYYPIDKDFQVKDPSVVKADFEKLVRIYPNKPIWFYQFGYPSSQDNGSSEERQAEFIRESFVAWDDFTDQIEMLDFTWLYDYSPAKIKETSRFYGIESNRFGSFIGTLGLIKYDGEKKMGFAALKEEAAKRGW